MIVKVQMPTRDEGAPTTISDPKNVLLHVPATRPLIARMRGKLRAYFHADVSSYEVEIGDEAPAQAW